MLALNVQNAYIDSRLALMDESACD